MSWIASLDTRAARWPLSIRGTYLAVKWALVGLGGFLVLRMALDRIGLLSIY
jgi:hypothetical protein